MDSKLKNKGKWRKFFRARVAIKLDLQKQYFYD